jgi:hypothetical protein
MQTVRPMPGDNRDGRNVGGGDENRPSWSPFDERMRDDERRRDRDRHEDRHASDRDRDRDRWGGGEPRGAPWAEGRSRESRLGRQWDVDRDEGYRMTERYGQGQSGYAAGRYGEDRSQRYQTRNQSYMTTSDEDRHSGLGIDDRFSGRGGPGYWEDRQVRGYPGAGRGEQRSDMPGGHRGKGPKGYTRSDDRIREQVSEVLADDDHVDATQIEVVVRNGEVILTGTVPDRRMKRMAEDCVERVSGVKDVQNQIRVHDTSNPSDGGGVSRDDRKHRA